MLISEEKFLQSFYFPNWNDEHFFPIPEFNATKIWICFDDESSSETKNKVNELEKLFKKDFYNRKTNFWIPDKSFIKKEI
jgi:hypothetical protein